MKIFTDGFFSVDPKHGFLPIQEPLLRLPSPYEALQAIIDEMPIRKANGEAGLLAHENQFEEAVKQLPNLIAEVSAEEDVMVLAALFRTYFYKFCLHLAPAHHRFLSMDDTEKLMPFYLKILHKLLLLLQRN